MDIYPSFCELFAVVILFSAIHGSSESEGKEVVITVPSGKVTRRVGDDLNLTCKVNSRERFQVTWIIPQDKVRQAHRVKVDAEHFNEITATIYQLEEPDTGWYTCVARQNDSSVNKAFNRTVYVAVTAYALPGRRPCYNQSFVCGNGYCIPKRYACDGHVDCHDSSDESPKNCGPDPCEDKVLCEDGRCLPRSLCCDPATQPDCRVTFLLSCCKKYLASIANVTTSLVGVLPGPPHQRLGTSVEYLQSSVYTAVSIAVVFILLATVLVAAICRIHMRRTVMASPFPFASGGQADHRCLPWCRPLHHPVTTAGVGFRDGSMASSCAHHLAGGADLRTVTCAHGSYVVATYSSSVTPGGRPKLHFLQQLPKPPEYSPLAQGPPPPYQSTEQLAASGNKEPRSGEAAGVAAGPPASVTAGHTWPYELWPRDESPPPRFSSVLDLSESEAQCLLPAFEEAVASSGGSGQCADFHDVGEEASQLVGHRWPTGGGQTGEPGGDCGAPAHRGVENSECSGHLVAPSGGVSVGSSPRGPTGERRSST